MIVLCVVCGLLGVVLVGWLGVVWSDVWVVVEGCWRIVLWLLGGCLGWLVG